MKHEQHEDAWECPSCRQDVNPDEDYICGQCEMPASHHLRATTLCRQLHDAHMQISWLIMERDMLIKLLDDTELKNAKMDSNRPELNKPTQQ